MAYNRDRYKQTNSKVIMGTLSALTGLVLSLWVFDNILETVYPLLYTCAGNGTYFNITRCCVAATNCVTNSNGSATVAGYFGTALTFVHNILPVVGIIAGYLSIRYAIKKMNY